MDAFPTLTPPFHFARTVRALAAGSFEPEGEEDRRVHTCGLAARVERIQGARDGDVYVQRGIITLLLTEPTTPFVMYWVDLKTVDEIGMEGVLLRFCWRWTARCSSAAVAMVRLQQTCSVSALRSALWSSTRASERAHLVAGRWLHLRCALAEQGRAVT